MPVFISFTQFGDWVAEPAQPGPGQTLRRSVTPRQVWRELVVSWNASAPAGSVVVVEARLPERGEALSEWLSLGRWAEGPKNPLRTSVNRQKTARATVETDILKTSKPEREVEIRVSLLPNQAGELPSLRFLGLSFTGESAGTATFSSGGLRAGSLELPEISQLDFEEGRGWCSPTCVAMVLGYWSRKETRPEWSISTPDVAAGVYDPAWPGTGNWPFNTAFAGSLPGMRAYVARLPNLESAKRWIEAGVPVITSVSYRILKGRANPEDGGHLVALAGTDANGDVVVYDPWTRREEGERVRKVFPREAFVRAWARSKNTAYLIYPAGWAVPEW